MTVECKIPLRIVVVHCPGKPMNGSTEAVSIDRLGTWSRLARVALGLNQTQNSSLGNFNDETKARAFDFV